MGTIALAKLLRKGYAPGSVADTFSSTCAAILTS
jgi:hypothetical protein